MQRNLLVNLRTNTLKVGDYESANRVKEFSGYSMRIRTLCWFPIDIIQTKKHIQTKTLKIYSIESNSWYYKLFLNCRL